MLILIHKIKIEMQKFIKYLSAHLPKKRNLWIFGAWGGKVYADNAKYMFEFVSQFHPKIKAIWLTNNREIIKDSKYKCCYFKSIKGIWYTLRAGVAFETEGEWDLSIWFSYKKTRVVQLWHGMGAKAMRWKNENGEIAHAAKDRIDRFRSYYWMAPSQLYVDLFTELMSSPKEHFCITGYPRNDTFITKPVHAYMESLKEKYPGYKFIIYMPTHRNFGKDGNQAINHYAFTHLDHELQKRKTIMVYKPHVHELKNFLQYENDFKNIIMAKEQEIWADVYAYLHYFDLLISDYSSVTTDFMCSGKPVLYFTYDIENYTREDGGLLDHFWTLAGGPFCNTWEEVLNEMDKAFESDPWKEERERCRKEYHVFNDGKNCERVYDAVIQWLKL